MKKQFFCSLIAASSALISLSPVATAQNQTAQQRVEFTQPFAPSEGFVKAPEKPARQELSLNGRWQFQIVPLPQSFVRDTGVPPELIPPASTHWETTPIKIPSPWNVNTWGNGRAAGEGTARPYVADSLYYPSYPPSWDGAQMGWLRRTFQVPPGWAAKRLVLHFEAVAGQAQVLINGKPAGNHFDSFLPFDLDITGLVKRGSENELLVGVRKSSLFNLKSANYNPTQTRTYPNGSNMDELVGIWNDVSLLGLPAIRVEDAFIKPLVDRGVLEAELTLRNDTQQPQRVAVGAEVKPWVNLAGTDVLSAPVPKWRLDATVLSLASQNITIPAGGTAKVTLHATVGSKLKFWTPDSPNLYGAVFRVSGMGGTVKTGTPPAPPLDLHYVRFGWRQFHIQGRDLLLNGKKIQLVGDFLHPFGPYMSSRRYVWQFYKTIKDMGGNSTRPHAQVHPRAYLDLADEMGLCVLDEASVFGSSINLNLKENITWTRLENHVDGLVMRDRNHPSVFGWSPGNEMFALFFETAPAERDREYVRLKALAQRPFHLDPTREWVSMDGDGDLEGTLPVWSKHLGVGLPNPDTLPDINKPHMIGEHGGTYYANPPRLEEINGDKSYESYAARNEALGLDAYRMTTQVARKELAVFSPSELAWFGLEHLPFGYRLNTHPPSKADGVFFPNYVENQPGVQIERLPPYAMTLNPGFDPALPAYKPMALFEAMQAALHPERPQPTRFAKMPIVVKRVQPAATGAIATVAFAGDSQGALYNSLSALGVPLTTGTGAANASLLVIDGETLSLSTAPTAKRLATEIWARGGLVWVMLRDHGAALAQLREILPATLNLTNRQATSLVPGQPDPALDGFGLGQLYFVAGDGAGDMQIQKAGMDGPLVANSKVLLRASNSDWSLFDRQPEIAKSSSMLIYENLQKPAGAALIEVPQGAGRLWVSTLDATTQNKAAEVFWTQLLRNVGIKITPQEKVWLVPTGQSADVLWRYTLEQPASTWTTPDFSDGAWASGKSGFGVNVPNGNPKTPWHSDDIYGRKEFTLDRVPTDLTLTIHHDEDVEVYLNGTLVFQEANFTTDYKQIPLGPNALAALKPGRNVIAVHCHQTAGGQFLDVGLVAAALPTNATIAPHNLLLDGPVDTK